MRRIWIAALLTLPAASPTCSQKSDIQRATCKLPASHTRSLPVTSGWP